MLENIAGYITTGQRNALSRQVRLELPQLYPLAAQKLLTHIDVLLTEFQSSPQASLILSITPLTDEALSLPPAPSVEDLSHGTVETSLDDESGKFRLQLAAVKGQSAETQLELMMRRFQYAGALLQMLATTDMLGTSQVLGAERARQASALQKIKSVGVAMATLQKDIKKAVETKDAGAQKQIQTKIDALIKEVSQLKILQQKPKAKEILGVLQHELQQIKHNLPVLFKSLDVKPHVAASQNQDLKQEIKSAPAAPIKPTERHKAEAGKAETSFKSEPPIKQTEQKNSAVLPAAPVAPKNMANGTQSRTPTHHAQNTKTTLTLKVAPTVIPAAVKSSNPASPALPQAQATFQNSNVTYMRHARSIPSPQSLPQHAQSITPAPATMRASMAAPSLPTKAQDTSSPTSVTASPNRSIGSTINTHLSVNINLPQNSTHAFAINTSPDMAKPEAMRATVTMPPSVTAPIMPAAQVNHSNFATQSVKTQPSVMAPIMPATQVIHINSASQPAVALASHSPSLPVSPHITETHVALPVSSGGVSATTSSVRQAMAATVVGVMVATGGTPVHHAHAETSFKQAQPLRPAEIRSSAEAREANTPRNGVEHARRSETATTEKARVKVTSVLGDEVKFYTVPSRLVSMLGDAGEKIKKAFAVNAKSACDGCEGGNCGACRISKAAGAGMTAGEQKSKQAEFAARLAAARAAPQNKT